MANFGTRIQQLRKEKLGENSTKVDLAIALRLHYPEDMPKTTEKTVGSWEAGKPPRWDTGILLAQYFGVSLSYLAGHTDDRGEPPMSDEEVAPGSPSDSDAAVAELGVLGDSRRAGRRRETARRGSSERRSES